MSSRFNKMAAPRINLTAVGPPALGLLQSARDVLIDPIENLALDPGALRRSAEMIVLFTDFGLHGPAREDHRAASLRLGVGNAA